MKTKLTSELILNLSIHILSVKLENIDNFFQAFETNSFRISS